MKLKYDDLMKNIQAEQIASVYLFVGPEDYLKEEAFDVLIEKLIDPGLRDFNLDVVYCEETGVDEIINLAATFPMMAERRLIIVKNLNRLPSSGLDRLAGHLRDLPSSSCLVLSATKLPQRSRLVAEASQRGAVVDFSPLYERQLPVWIKQRLRRTGKSFSPQVIRTLQDSVGNDLPGLVNEIEKLVAYVGQRDSIGPEDVETVVGKTRLNSVFDLTDSIAQRQTDRALVILDRMLRFGQSPVGIISMIARHLSILLKVQELLRQETPQSEMASQAGVHPYYLKGYIQQSKNFTTEELEDRFQLLCRADWDLKSGAGPQQLTMELLIHDLCR